MTEDTKETDLGLDLYHDDEKLQEIIEANSSKRTIAILYAEYMLGECILRQIKDLEYKEKLKEKGDNNND